MTVTEPKDDSYFESLDDPDDEELWISAELKP